MILLDANASMPLCNEAKAVMTEAIRADEVWTADSLGFAEEVVKEALGVDEGRVVFTSGGTESAALFFTGLGPCRVLCSTLDHVSTLLLGGRQISFRYAPLEGFVLTPDVVGQALRADPGIAAVSLCAVNSETGMISDVDALASAVKTARPVPVFLDVCQALGRIPVRVPETVDAVSLSARKIGGPAGTGALWIRDPCAVLDSTWGGGFDQLGRPGSIDGIGIAGMLAALLKTPWDVAERIRDLRDGFDAAIGSLPGTGVVQGNRVCNTSLYVIEEISARVLALVLKRKGVQVGTGTSAFRGTTMRSPLLAVTYGEGADNTIRVSLSPQTTARDTETAAGIMAEAIATLRSC